MAPHTGLNGVEEICPLCGLLDVRVDQERVRLGVNVFHHDLEAVEAASLRDLDLSAETLHQVLVDDAIGSGEESKNVRDEVLLIVGNTVVPVVQVFG